MVKSIRIMLWNANGLLKHKHELELILETKQIDICLISETHFTNQSYFSINNFITYHTIHPRNCARGGSAVIVRSSIKHYEETKISIEEFQVTTITVETGGFPIRISALYSPPRHSIDAEKYKEIFETIGDRFIIGGDFNAKHTHWGSRLITPKGRQLFKSAEDCGCEFVSTGKPTYWPTDTGEKPDLIDFFVVKKISSLYLKVEEGDDLNSDHSPVYLTLSSNIVEKESNPYLTNKYTDWEYFRNLLVSNTNIVPEAETEEDLDEAIIKLTNSIQDAAWKSTPIIKRKLPGRNYPTEVRNMVKEKRKLRRRWQRTRNPEIKTLLNSKTKELSLTIKDIENSTMQKTLTELSNDKSSDYSLWKATKRLKNPINQIPPLMDVNNKWAKSNLEKAEVFAKHLTNTFSPNDDIDGSLPSGPYDVENQEIARVSIHEVKYEIQNNLALKKSPGYDLITAEVLIQLPFKSIISLTNILNSCFRLQYVPSVWKAAEVLMIAKPGKPATEVSSYRPISLLSVLSKLLEKLFIKQLKQIIDEKLLIPIHQFGFREQHSTLDQIHRITDVIEKAFEEKKVCSAVFLDVSQAFDKVWHDGLMHKLRNTLPESFCNFLQSYLTERYFRVKQEDSYSNLFPISAGVPQGSILGPLLYLLFTSDVPTSNEYVTATFADDTALLAIGKTPEESTNTLQTAINEVSNWTKKWRIKLNESKSVHVDFSYKDISQRSLYLDNNIIPYSNSAKYLGMTLDAKLRWKEHVKKKKEALDLKFSKMYWLIGRHSTLSIYNKLLIYKQVLKPVWTYGIQLWGCTSKNNIEIIQRFQNKVLRTIVNAPWYIRNKDLHRDLNVAMVQDEICRFAQQHAKRLSIHANDEVAKLIQIQNSQRRLKRVRPLDLAQEFP